MTTETLVVLFLRGGMDGLNLICPTGDSDLIAARPEVLRVTRKGDDAGHVMSNPAADVDFRFHRQARELSELYEAGDLAVVHAAGLTDGTRSHFDAEDRMERAAPKAGALAGGWLGRWLTADQPEGVLPVLAIGDRAPDSLRGSKDVAVAASLDGLTMPGDTGDQQIYRPALMAGFGSHPLMQAPLNRLLTLNDTLRGHLFGPDGDLITYQGAVEYPQNDLAEMLRPIAQAIKLDLGLRVATVDFGGWDTHEDQADEFATQADALSTALSAFWRDLGTSAERATVVVMSEFGRRLRANTSAGTDHGFGNAMMVLGPNVRGGRMHGDWPGLANEALDDGADLAITTDYRQVLAEVLRGPMAASTIGDIFPGFTAAPMALFQ